jgi:hypothetical protein
MSATVETTEVYYAYCADCATGSDGDGTEFTAEGWAADHNAECHETDNSDDEAYEKFKESRGNSDAEVFS